MLLLLSILFSPLISSTTSVKVPQCNQMQFNLNVSSESGTVLYKLGFLVDVQISSPLHNDVILSNFTRWSYNESYYEPYPMEFFVESLDIGTLCNQTLPSCGMKNMRDGFATVLVNIQNGPHEVDEEWFMNFWFVGGTLYNSKYGQMFDPVTDPCFHEVIDWGIILFTADYCCTNFFEVDIPDPSAVTQTCTEFYSDTNFTSSDGAVLAYIGTLYDVNNKSIDASVNQFSGPNEAYYYLTSNLDDWVKPCEDTSVEFPCVISQLLNDTNKDHTYSFNINVWDIALTYDWDAIAAQLIKRKGVWMKNVENPVPYTPSDPCWTRVVDSNNGTTSSTSFCCKKWVPINHSTCAEYRTKTIVNINSAPADVLNARYILNSNNTMTVQIVNYTTPSNNINQKVQLESFASTGEDQLCSSNATFWNTCLFNEYGNDNYTLIMRTSDFPDGWNMVVIGLQGQQLVSPSISVQNPCHTETHDYNGLNPSTTAQTEICCIASPNGPWPGSS